MKQNSKRRKYLPSILIQQIRLQWHKDCRGGNAAAQRNQYEGDFTAYFDDDDMFWGHTVEVCGSLENGIESANIAG